MDSFRCSICDEEYSVDEHARSCEREHRERAQREIEKGVQGRKEIPVRLQTVLGRLLIWIGSKL